MQGLKSTHNYHTPAEATSSLPGLTFLHLLFWVLTIFYSYYIVFITGFRHIRVPGPSDKSLTNDLLSCLLWSLHTYILSPRLGLRYADLRERTVMSFFFFFFDVF